MIIFLPNFIYSDDILALMRKHYGRPIVCHLRWGRRGEPTCQRCQRARMGLVEFGISMRHLDSSTWHLHAASQGVGRLAAGVSGLIYYFHVYFLRSLFFSLVHLVFLHLHDAVYFLRLTVHLPPSPFTCFIFLFRGLARRPSSCLVYLCDRSLE